MAAKLRCGTETVDTGIFCLSGTYTGMKSGSGSGFLVSVPDPDLNPDPT